MREYIIKCLDFIQNKDKITNIYLKYLKDSDPSTISANSIKDLPNILQQFVNLKVLYFFI